MSGMSGFIFNYFPYWVHYFLQLIQPKVILKSSIGVKVKAVVKFKPEEYISVFRGFKSHD